MPTTAVKETQFMPKNTSDAGLPETLYGKGDYSAEEIRGAMERYIIAEGGEQCEHRDCNANAMFFAAKSSLKPELIFCGHHGKRHLEGLKSAGFHWYDKTTELESGVRNQINI